MRLSTLNKLSTPLLFLGTWEAISRSGIVSPTLFPPPSMVALAGITLIRNGLLLDIMVSLSRVIAGLSIGSVAGIFIGILTGRNPALDEALSPLFNVMRAFPPVALIPLIITWFGIGETAKIFSIALAVLFPVWVNTHIGAKRVPAPYIHAAQTLTRSRYTIYRKVIFPSCAPFSLAGIRNGVAIAFIMMYVSELAGASNGLGYQIAVSHLSYAIDKMMAAILILGLIAALTDNLFVKLVHRVAPWIR